MLHLGDITKIDGAKAPAVEVVIGGSPCQDLSVAGKRAGLAGERSGLFMEQIRIIKEMRRESERSGANVVIPRFMVWENVPGAFSSNGGEDFRAVLEETAQVADASASIPRPRESWTNSGAVMGNGWSIAWRVLDAQFWGVPQRRRRIALVADFGGFTAPEILFERNGLSRNNQPSGTPWKDFASAIAERFGGADNTEQASKSVDHHVVFNGETITNKLNRSNPKIGDPCHTLSTRGASMCYCVRERCGCEGGGKGLLVQNNRSGTLSTSNDEFVVAFKYKQGSKARSIGYQEEISPCLSGEQDVSVVAYDDARRLTPLEEERLQGYPDGWTDIGTYIDSHGKERKTSDSSRYKALGNSIALPPWAWILERLNGYCTAHTMASLFDGIGGFPLIWETLNGKGSCLWASEIEEFPIAVTKYRFK